MIDFKTNPHQLTENVKILQKTAIIRSVQSSQITPNSQVAPTPEVLLLQRSAGAKSRPSCWDLPGGNSEWPSAGQLSIANLHQADIAREVMEETSLQADAQLFTLEQMTHFSTYFDSDKQVFTVICGWLLDFVSTNQAAVQISSEHQNYIWVAEANLPNYDFGGASGAFVLDIIQKSFAKFNK